MVRGFRVGCGRKGHVGAGAESARNVTTFGVECEFGGGRGL